MKLHSFRSLLICAVAMGAFAVSPGCKSSPEAGDTVASMDSFGVQVAAVKDSIDSALKALGTVVGSQASDFRANFDAYSKSVAALDKQANVVRDRAKEMRSMGDAFFKEWEPPANVTPERR